MKTLKKSTQLALLLLLSMSCVADPCLTDKDSESAASEDAIDAKTADCTTDDDEDEDDSVVTTPDREPSSEEDDNNEDDTQDQTSLSSYIASTVDRIQNRSELAKVRELDGGFAVDSCHSQLDGQDRFSDSIAFSIDELSKGRKIQLQGLGSIFGYSTNPSTYKDVSLISHKLCDVTAASLKHTMGKRKQPIASTRALAQRFADDHNRYRAQHLNNNSQGTKNFKRLWGRFFGCLAYTESLTTADTSTSERVADQFSSNSYRKPAGVKFYIDPRQSQASKLNIGLFQFTPSYGGNINPCVKQWNKEYPSCQISSRTTNGMIDAVGSSRQTFNAYCGVHKLVQTFFVQSHSNQTKRTHPDNFKSGSLKSAANRCVTPHIHASLGYNHFGPLQNTTGSNLKKIMSCIYK